MTTSTSDTRTTELIRRRAVELGFDACRFADAREAWDAATHLHQFVQAGRHGEMGWMADTEDRRRHPTAMWEGARSAIMLGVNYGPDHDPLEALKARDRGVISVYAQGDDYHELIKGRLKQLASFVASWFGGELKVFVDTAPLMEKPLAERAGLGWQGKHTNLVSREFGSWLFLGSILTELELAPDGPSGGSCGQCRACLDACPTGAFPAPYQLDARRCISYLTIELKGPVPAELRPRHEARTGLLHRLPDHRAEEPDPAGVPAPARQPHLRLRRLPGGLPVEQVRRPGARAAAGGARGAEGAGFG